MKRFFSSRLLTSGLRTSVIWGHMFTVMVADSPRLELRVPTEDSVPSGEADVPMWKPEDLAKNLNWDLPTMGGRQFWGDIVFLSGWRIQHNVVTDHYRLLDSHDVRRAWGREEECRAALKTFQEKGQIPKMSGRAVILVHGIIRSSKSFSSLTKRLAETGATVVPFDYPSTRVDLETSTGYLQKVIDSLEGIEEIDFVVHSMGGILVRSYLKATEQNPDPRLRRMVMMGVPNHGARIANLVKDLGAFKMIFGPAGQELVEDVDGVIASLPKPRFEFGIIAGARGTNDGWNPLIPGDDDGTVSVDSASLDGARDTMTVPVLHSFIMTHPKAIEATVHFLDHGNFSEAPDENEAGAS